jgi:hypothetical protein
MAKVYNPKTKKYEEVSDETAASTPRYTGARVGTSAKGGSTVRQASQTPRNLRGASTATARGIMGLGAAPQMPSPKELLDIQGPSNQGTGGGGGANYKSMLDALQKLASMSQRGINQSMDTLTSTLQAQTNPFADFKAQQTETTPGLEQLLQSQGVSTDPLQQYATAINAQNTGQAKAFQNLADTLSGFNTANQEGMIADVGQQRADLLNQLQGSVFGTGAKLMGKKAPDRNAIVQMLLQSMKNRA